MESRKYFGCRMFQRGDEDTVAFFIFIARVNDVKDWVGVKRSKDYPEGTQRILREGRKRAIVRFLQNGTINTIPNNILLAFDPNGANFISTDEKIHQCYQEADIENGCGDRVEWGFLEFSFDETLPEHQRPALIVDGQHRFLGMAEYKNEDMPVLFVCLLNATLTEQAFQFIVINSKAVKVPIDNAKAIIEGVDDEMLRDRLLKAGVNYANTSPVLRDIDNLENSPFKSLLDWDYNREGKKIITLTSIEQCLKYNENMFTFLNDDEDSKLDLFFSIWNAVKGAFQDYWDNINEENKEQDKFFKKVNINAINEFLTERVKKAWEFGMVDVFDSKNVEDRVSEILEKLSPEFWKCNWIISIQDNANVRKLIKQDLETMILNHNLGRPWFEDLKLPSNVAE